MKIHPTNPPCPCGSGEPYTRCCQPLHMGNAALDAEALMRSRYTAFALRLEDYLLQSWHPDTRPESLDLSQDNTKWLGLKISRHEVTGENSAIVEFIARYKINGKAEKLHEVSRFIKIENRWYYLDGAFV